VTKGTPVASQEPPWLIIAAGVRAGLWRAKNEGTALKAVESVRRAAGKFNVNASGAENQKSFRRRGRVTRHR